MKTLAASPLASRGFAPRGDKKKLGEIRKRTKEIFCIKKGPRKSSAKKRTKETFCKKNGGVFFVFFFGAGDVLPPKKIA